MPGTEIVPQTHDKATSGSASDGFQPTATMPADVPPSQRRRWERLGHEAVRSYRAAVELRCLDCVCWQRPEARDCAIRTCALWAMNRRIFAREDAT